MKNKVYVIEEKEKEKVYKSSLVEFILGIITYAIILLIVNNLFKGFYINGFYWAIIASLIISLLNSTIKPILVIWSLPLTIYTLGLAYPIVNMIILKITSLLLGNNFTIKGFLSIFVISIFISILRIVFDRMVVKPMMRRID